MKARQDLTFKHNIKRGRHGWLRLTPAYSVKLVDEILNEIPRPQFVLDPFCGTGTTGLVCAERGINCDVLEINPFLVWFAGVKTRSYSEDELIEVRTHLEQLIDLLKCGHFSNQWVPPIANINRWWAPDKQRLLSRIRQAIASADHEITRNLLNVALCQKIIEWSNAAFNHQSMSFKAESATTTPLWHSDDDLLVEFHNTALAIILGAATQISGVVNVIHADSRNVPKPINGLYDCVITSPPYPNRMSYIRELRPYMYWLEFLQEAREAGELDWLAIGGTWGTATSNVGRWQPNGIEVSYPGFQDMIKDIAGPSKLLANYVHKYFSDIVEHVTSLFPALASGAQMHYIVGNSKFYNTLVPVEEIYAEIFTQVGFIDPNIEPIRKRNSKKELFEYVVSARKP